MRRQLAVVVAATTSLVLLALLIPVAILLYSQAEQRAVSEATLRAQSLAQQVPTLSSDSDDLGDGVTVFLPDDELVGEYAKRSSSVELAATGRSFSAETRGGVEVLVPSSSSDGEVAVVRVFVSDASLESGVVHSLSVLGGVVLVLFALGLLVADRLGRRMVLAVDGMAETADRLSTGDVTARAPLRGPSELRRVAGELNRLATRIGELLSSEREEVADLAHRLRTPLTALRMNIDNLADTPQARRLSESVETLTGHIDQLIRAARRPVREGVAPRADLAEVAAERLRFWGSLAEDDERELTGDVPQLPVPVRAAADDVSAALDALLDNAFGHTPEGSPIHVLVEAGGRVVVADAGEGFSVEATGRGHSGGGSTGLGLDIARRAAEASGGIFEIGCSNMGGSQVVLRFGVPN